MWKCVTFDVAYDKCVLLLSYSSKNPSAKDCALWRASCGHWFCPSVDMKSVYALHFTLHSLLEANALTLSETGEVGVWLFLKALAILHRWDLYEDQMERMKVHKLKT